MKSTVKPEKAKDFTKSTILLLELQQTPLMMHTSYTELFCCDSVNLTATYIGIERAYRYR